MRGVSRCGDDDVWCRRETGGGGGSSGAGAGCRAEASELATMALVRESSGRSPILRGGRGGASLKRRGRGGRGPATGGDGSAIGVDGADAKLSSDEGSETAGAAGCGEMGFGAAAAAAAGPNFLAADDGRLTGSKLPSNMEISDLVPGGWGASAGPSAPSGKALGLRAGRWPVWLGLGRGLAERLAASVAAMKDADIGSRPVDRDGDTAPLGSETLPPVAWRLSDRLTARDGESDRDIGAPAFWPLKASSAALCAGALSPRLLLAGIQWLTRRATARRGWWSCPRSH